MSVGRTSTAYLEITTCTLQTSNDDHYTTSRGKRRPMQTFVPWHILRLNKTTRSTSQRLPGTYLQVRWGVLTTNPVPRIHSQALDFAGANLSTTPPVRVRHILLCYRQKHQLSTTTNP